MLLIAGATDGKWFSLHTCVQLELFAAMRTADKIMRQYKPFRKDEILPQLEFLNIRPLNKLITRAVVIATSHCHDEGGLQNQKKPHRDCGAHTIGKEAAVTLIPPNKQL